MFTAHHPLPLLLGTASLPCLGTPLSSHVVHRTPGQAWPRRTSTRTWAGIWNLLPWAPELVQHWPWAAGGQQRGVAREDCSKVVMFKRSPS